MILRWLLLAVIIFLARRIVLGLLGKGRAAHGRMSGGRTHAQQKPPPARPSERKREQDEIAAGQRIEEAEFEELD